MLKFCVLGAGISYTLSPLIHQTIFRRLGVEASYTAEDLSPARLEANIGRLKETYDGFNVTKPHKTAILPYLSAKKTPLEAVNVVRRDGGAWTGYNTDLNGFAADLTARAGEVADNDALVLGAGGAAEAVVCALTTRGARVTVLNRTFEKARALAAKFGASAVADARGLRPELLINCTSVGNRGECALPPCLDLSALRFAYDLVYAPLQTAFMTVCAGVGAQTSNGLGMLIRQAIFADEIFLGQKLDVETLYGVVAETLKKELL